MKAAMRKRKELKRLKHMDWNKLTARERNRLVRWTKRFAAEVK